MTCRCIPGGLCTCAVIANRPTLGDYTIVFLCVAVYLAAFAMAVSQ